MSSSFVHAPRVESGGTDVDNWLAHNWERASWHDEDGAVVETLDGTIPLQEAAIIFRDFKPVLGTAGAYFATPVGLCEFRAGIRASMCRKKSAHIQKHDVIIPLGRPIWGTRKAKTVLRQTARQWVSGSKNTADMKDDHVLNMYYSALQGLVFAAGKASTGSDQKWLFVAMVALARAFATIHSDEPLFQKVTTAMVMTPGVNDMLQKALSHVFHPRATWDREVRLNILQVIVRRNLRHGTSMVGLATGPFVLFILAPLLRGLAMAPAVGDFNENVSKLIEKFNAAATNLLKAYVGASSSDAKTMQVKTLAALSTAAGCELTVEQVQTLLDFSRSTPSMSVTPDWVAMGALPAPPDLEMQVSSERYSIAGKPCASFAARIKVLSPSSARVFGFKGTEWSGIKLGSCGHYRIVANDLGIAEEGQGNTRGRELVANWRLTVGSDILPRNRAGYSSAGMESMLNPQSGGRWSYITKTPVPFGIPFFVTVTESAVFLRCAGREYFRMLREGADVLLGFKNVWMDVSYKPMTIVDPVDTVASVASVASAAPVDTAVSAAPTFISIATHTDRLEKPNYAAAAATATLDLPPTALLAKLRDLASTAAK